MLPPGKILFTVGDADSDGYHDFFELINVKEIEDNFKVVDMSGGDCMWFHHLPSFYGEALDCLT